MSCNIISAPSVVIFSARNMKKLFAIAALFCLLGKSGISYFP